MGISRFICLGILLLAAAPAAALELFGVELQASARDQLREAAKTAGMVLIREGGEENWFDVYDSSAVLAGSSRLYLGFVRQDQRFAFAEYEFRGLRPGSLVRDLSRKYGVAEVRGGRFVSDTSYHWQRDGIRIDLVSDWHNYKTRLSYVDPAGLAALQAEMNAAAATAEVTEPRVSLY